MKCFHLLLSDEAVQIGPMGEAKVDVHLCDWPEQHPERFVNAPRWINRLIGGGLMIRPETDCAGCPGFTTKMDA